MKYMRFGNSTVFHIAHNEDPITSGKENTVSSWHAVTMKLLNFHRSWAGMVCQLKVDGCTISGILKIQKR